MSGLNQHVPVQPFLTVLPMTVAHLPQIMAIERQAYPFPWTEGMFLDSLRQQHICWVAFSKTHPQENVLVGYLVAYIAVGECHILNVCVSPQQQKQGVGQHLMAQILIHAQNQSVEAVFLEVRPSNHAAIALYEKLGFEQVGCRKNYYPAGDQREDALLYRFSF